MIKQIIQQLLEYQGEISSMHLSKSLHQPLSIVEEELMALQENYPALLTLSFNNDRASSFIFVRIAEGGEYMAKAILGKV